MNNIIKFRGKIIDFSTFPYDIKKIKKSLFNKHQNILIYLIKKIDILLILIFLELQIGIQHH